MSIAELGAIITGVLGALGALWSLVVQSRRDKRTGKIEDSRLGLDTLEAALDAQARRIEDLEERVREAEERERQCMAETQRLQSMLNRLMIEGIRDR